MSRAYRIQVRETLKKVLHAEDGARTQLELLEILPGPRMAELLTGELAGRGYEHCNAQMVKRLDGGVVVRVDPATGVVVVQAEECREIELEGETEGRTYDDVGKEYAERLRAALKSHLREGLEQQARQQEDQLQDEVRNRIESQLVDLKRELDDAVHQATVEALKIKAAQLGSIKELNEDRESGALTIVVEV